MTHYLDIELLPDSETLPQTLMSFLFGKLHKALTELKLNNVGVSFPEVKEQEHFLGTKLRLHSNQETLLIFTKKKWLGGMFQQVKLHPVTEVPSYIQGYCNVSRVQVKNNVERIRRRQMKRKQITHAEAGVLVSETAAKYLNLPFVSLYSTSTKQEFKFFIKHATLQQKATEGEFSSYGTSNTTTIPWL